MPRADHGSHLTTAPGPARYAGITAAVAVPISLARAGAPLVATSLPGRSPLVAAAAVALVSAVILAAIRGPARSGRQRVPPAHGGLTGEAFID